MGYTPETVERMRARLGRESEAVHVMEDCWDACRVFPLCEWNRVSISGMSQARILVTGIDAREVECVARCIGVEFCEELLWQVRIMEAEARSIKNAH